MVVVGRGVVTTITAVVVVRIVEDDNWGERGGC